ncbi:hypothetical protein HOY34_05105 [Xinfangfangia sp. D13-10-4-6]|uniref:hypothetical protein n=1 Tax=Pseudogemmobacter hezensis TaxID=2737662 RepID=UPI001552C323|nr:hypothetical protein [Pseudogemmobacter hezensis]NPD14579.1 hypothetical protein [Pseudogemmobacter hezensis]
MTGSKTALSKYQRLESIGLWRDTPEGQRREVVVLMGEATLVISDFRSGRALSHWSLPAVQRINPGQKPAIFAPGEDSPESVEIDDEHMLAALKMVQSAVRAARPHPGRLRGLLIGASLLALAGLVTFVLPRVLVSHTVSVVPPTKRAELGMRALDEVTRLTGTPCTGELGLPALAELSERVFGAENTPILFVLPEGLTRPAHLPGGVILLPRSLIEEDAPDALAGAALIEGLRAKQSDPMHGLLYHAGLRATFELLTSGDLPASALDGFGEEFLRNEAALPSVPVLAGAFNTAGLRIGPYADWLAAHGGGEEAAALAAADVPDGTLSPLLPDDSWMALQSVCSEG